MPSDNSRSSWNAAPGIEFEDYVDRFNPSDCESNYGGRMLLSSLADWAEWMALVSTPPSWANVVDAITDSRGTDAYSTNLTGGDFFSDCDGNVSEDLRSVIEVRVSSLGDRYPFEFDDRDRLRVRDGCDLTTSAYTAMLQISMLKGCTSPKEVPYDPYTSLFEHIVAGAFRKAGYDASIVGTSRKGKTFEERLSRTSGELSMPSDSSKVAHSAGAKDDKVDVVAGRFFRDGRKGEAVILTQATCAQDGKWETKLSEIPFDRWRGYFLGQMTPVGYLAIPYHASEENSAMLTGLDARCSFLDRIRLTLMLGGRLEFLDDESKALNDKVNEYVRRYLSTRL